MCDRITMPDGTEIESTDPDGGCLCVNTQTEILLWIVQRTPCIEIGQRLIISRSPFGWDVNIESVCVGEDNRTPQH